MIAHCSEHSDGYVILTADYIDTLIDFMIANCEMMKDSPWSRLDYNWGRAYVFDAAHESKIEFVYGTGGNQPPDGQDARFAVVPVWLASPTEAAIEAAGGRINYYNQRGERYQYRIWEAGGDRAIERITTINGRDWRGLEYLT